MNSKNLGSLPSEIIQEILKHAVYSSFRIRYVEYQLINRHWHFASLNVVYRTLILNKSIAKFDNFGKLETFSAFCKIPHTT